MDSRHLIVGGSAFEPPAGVRVTNWTDGVTHRFEGERRERTVSEIIVHESVTATAEDAVSVLRKRGYGLHLVIDPAGGVTQHGDLATDRLVHAGGHNGPSVGIEFVNLYYASLLRKHHPWTTVIRTAWAHKKQYVVPTVWQLEAGTALLRWITALVGTDLEVPRRWIGLAPDKPRLRMGRVPGADARRGGIYAHHYFHHADGAFPVAYAFLRLEVGLDARDAYAEAVRLASGVKTGGIDLRGHRAAYDLALALA